MEFSIKQGSPEKQASNCVVVAVYEDSKLSAAAELIDQASNGLIRRLIERGDITGKAGSVLLIPEISGIKADRALIVGLGKSEETSAKNFIDASRAVAAVLQKSPYQEACLFLHELKVDQRDRSWQIRQLVQASTDADHRSDQHKSKPAEAASLQKLMLGQADKPSDTDKQALNQAVALSQGMSLCKELGNLPGNICTPTYLATQAQLLGKQHKIKVQVLEEKDMEKLGMGSLLSVAKGSDQPAKLITLEYKGGDKKQKPIALVGKGVTFDSGGISLKPGAEMDEMKFDMCGAATVLGTFKAIAEMGLKLNVVGVIPATENLPNGQASKPGDIVTSMSGQTIEILNTDAEGRLILCDALTYTAKFEPRTVIDIATLTGACIIALGHVASGLFSNNDELANELLASADYAHDKVWRLPLWDDYQPQLDSNFADMQNIGGRAGGSITAACFLSRFTKDFRWAHLDIAGTAWRSGKDKGATGRPVPMLVEYLIRCANQA